MAIKKIQIIAPGYVNVLHPETDSTVVLMEDASTLESFKTNSTGRLATLEGHTNEAFINVTLPPFNAVGDGVTDDTVALQTADALGKILFFPSGNYISTFVPTNKCKGLGATLTVSGYPMNLGDIALQVNSAWQTYIRMNNTAIGLDAGSKLSTAYANVAIGDKALQNNVAVVRNTAIGNNSLQQLTEGYGNTAIGVDALHLGTCIDRNTMVGATSGKHIGNKTITEVHEYFKTGGDTTILDSLWSGWRTFAGSIAVPNFVAVTADDTTSNVGVGRNALGFAITPKRNVALGYNALEGGFNADSCVAVGESSMQFGINALNSVHVGARAGFHMCESNQDVFVGKASGAELIHSDKNIGVGYQAMGGLAITNKLDKPVSNIAIGRIAMANAKGSYIGNVAVGGSSLIAVEGSYNTALGHLTAGYLTTGTSNTALGYNALNNSGITTYDNTTGLGANSTVTGSNQVQLGNSATTPYAWVALQLRSDARDKIDIVDTELGLEFINKLRPVQYRQNFRESYVDYDADGVVHTVPQDGSRAGTRFHQGLIAQEVKEVMDEMNVDFAGFQDHKVNGGQDVLSIGYEELITPLIKSIQEQQVMIDILKQEIDLLKARI